MDIVQEALKWTGLDPALFGLAFTLALVLRFARASFHWAGEELTFAVAVLLAAGGALLKVSQHEAASVTASNGLGLLVAVLVLQGVLKAAAEKVPFLPKENQWVKQPVPPSNQ